ncbi:hypothetical protein POJ06DRAFT_199023 [Lipomyces tetrasporus]|uniref:Zf-CHY-domain-containing protein n=1 Tax=Lipomyces tetrasporus TaxID=54092 RepID=A0AAD7QQI2_9ASCO|nr:uncharacterized protein POJ06DRAFT_199023 [Lipomyces tetrasporus]KAJ8099405.1 hypothetical protein POJ06DRAFT_199023 [Lipomyces tetrasporus]
MSSRRRSSSGTSAIQQSNNYIPQISNIGGFPPLPSIRLPDFLPRRFLQPSETLCADVGRTHVLESDSDDDVLSSTLEQAATVRPNGPRSTTISSLWPSLSPPRITPTSLPSLPSFPAPSLPALPSITFSARSFLFPRHLANYLFANVDFSDGDDFSNDEDDGNTSDTRTFGSETHVLSRMGLPGDAQDGDGHMDSAHRRTRTRSNRRHRRRRGQDSDRGSRGADEERAELAATADPVDMANSAALFSEEKQRQLRQRIYAIQNMDISEKELAMKMHELMMEDYYKLRRRQESEDDVADDQDDYENEATELPTADSADKTVTWFDEANEIRGCPHYQRGVKLQCSTCEQWYACRFCHDEVEDHQLIRSETKNMLCTYCFLPQSAAQDCRGCGRRMARYFCDKCKLWDDDPDKSIYHCNDCGICRIGEGLGKDFFHCKTCNVCMSVCLENSHRCIEHSTECNCPICGDYMFTSTMTVVFMSCGHSIHQKCYYEHTKNSYKCPTCARSIVNMEAQFRLLDREIERQRLPEPYCNWRSVITCNDCSGKSNVQFHFLGFKCDFCRSYNTAQVRLIKPEEGADLDDGEFDEVSVVSQRGQPEDPEDGLEQVNSEDEEVRSEITEVLGEVEDIHSMLFLPPRLQDSSESPVPEESDGDSTHAVESSDHHDEGTTQFA